MSTRMRWRTVAVLAIGVAIGTTMMATPAAGHITSSVTHVRDHMKQFFYTKAQSDNRYERDSANLWAVVKADGSIARHEGVTANFKCIGGCDGQPGAYEIVFNRNVSTCAFTATISTDTAGRGSQADSGQVGVRPLSTSTQGVSVTTYNSAGARTDKGFTLIVSC